MPCFQDCKDSPTLLIIGITVQNMDLYNRRKASRDSQATIHPLRDGVTAARMLGQHHRMWYHLGTPGQIGILTISTHPSHIGVHLEVPGVTGTTRAHPTHQRIGLQHLISLLEGNPAIITNISQVREDNISILRVSNHNIGHHTDLSRMGLTGVVKVVNMEWVGLAVQAGFQGVKRWAHKHLTLEKVPDPTVMVCHMVAQSSVLEQGRLLHIKALVKGKIGNCPIERTMEA